MHFANNITISAYKTYSMYPGTRQTVILVYFICSVNFSNGQRLPDALALPAVDSQWVDATLKKAAIKLQTLDMDLKNYKSNSIKESIR